MTFDHCENMCLALAKSTTVPFCSVFFIVHAKFLFMKIFCIPTFLKLLYFLPSHCQLSLANLVEFRGSVKIWLLCITSDETCWYCMCLWAEGSEWRASGSERTSHSCNPSTSYLLYVVFDTINFISGIWNYLCIYSFVLYLYVVALCVLTLTTTSGAVQLNINHLT